MALLSARVAAAHSEEGDHAHENEEDDDPGHEHQVDLHEASTVDLVAVSGLGGLEGLVPLCVRLAIHALELIA